MAVPDFPGGAAAPGSVTDVQMLATLESNPARRDPMDRPLVELAP
jgi:hypothetical protein